MKKTIFTILPAVLLVLTAIPASAQFEVNTPTNPYRYTYPNGVTLKINWKPESAKTIGRYTVAVNPSLLINNGLKFDFEMELPGYGQWLQAGISGYFAPERHARYDGRVPNRYLPASSWWGFRSMRGAGLSVLYKKMLHRRGWYFSTGLALNWFRVEYTGYGYIPFEEDGLEFYRRGRYPVTQSFFRPTAEFNIGKHFALTDRLFIDLYAGTRLALSFYKSQGYDQKFDTMYGFAYSGIDILHGGVRFGVLLWDKR